MDLNGRVAIECAAREHGVVVQEKHGVVVREMSCLYLAAPVRSGLMLSAADNGCGRCLADRRDPSVAGSIPAPRLKLRT
jgi:hypothetical protein